MTLLKFSLTHNGAAIDSTVRHRVPVFAYEPPPDTADSTLGLRRIVTGETLLDESVEGSGIVRWTHNLGGETLIGTSASAFANWATVASWDEFLLEIGWEVATPEGVVFATGSHEALLGIDRDAMTTIKSRAREAKVVISGTLMRRATFLVNASIFRELLQGLTSVSDERRMVELIARAGVFTSGTAQPLMAPDAEGVERLADELEVAGDDLRRVLHNWDELTTFPVAAGAPIDISAGGTITIIPPEGEPIAEPADLAFYELSAEVPVATLDDGPRLVRWSPPPQWPAGASELPAEFTLDPERPVAATAALGPAVVRVRSFDGSLWWSDSFDLKTAAGREGFASLDIAVPGLPPDDTTDVVPTRAAPSGRQLRGQVLREGAGEVGGLTLVLQGHASDADGTLPPDIVAAATTSAQGSFWMPFPTGSFASASVLVSVAPDSRVELTLDGNGFVKDEFVYLLISDDDVVGGRSGTGRLPDHDQLLRSDEFRQDLGGGCVNVTTPNRSLREYRYNAIVRTSDPDVANYALIRSRDGSYRLEGGSAKVVRSAIDLDNPVLWRDAPDSGDNLSLYQAVTVATGHILWFRSVFKADGYSLGDLVYSLPLAPGQKKQIVSYDVANTLSAAETQRLSQGESLAASLFEDRMITDELSGSIDEQVSGRSSASTAGVSAGLGLGGAIGPIGGSLGVSGGYANSKSSASQKGARNVAQAFGEKLRQSLIQNSEAYREINASVVTTVREGEQYAVMSEVVANHNHCHSMTMMYFEVLRHFAITQELADVAECIFVPLLMTDFDEDNVSKWKDTLASALRPMPSNTYAWPFLLDRLRLRHPLAKAFDANDRVRTNWARVDYPTGTYAEDPITKVDGSIELRVRLPRPRTNADRIMSLPIITETVVSKETDVVATAAKAFITGGLSLLDGADENEVRTQVLRRKDIGDQFLALDDNFQTVPPARAIRVTRFEPLTITSSSGTSETLDFFGNPADKAQWQAYATLLDYDEAWELLDAHFKGNLIAEWDTIFNRDIAPLLYQRVLESVVIEGVGGPGLDVDLTPTQRYEGGDRRMSLRVRGSDQPPREDLAPELRIRAASTKVQGLRNVTLDVHRVSLYYSTPFYRGPIYRGHVGDDLLDDVDIPIPLTKRDRRDPRDEDRWLRQQLLDHLNANVEYYNAALWRGLDENRRYLLLDGFSIQTYNPDGTTAGLRSLASVVENELVTIAGNALVFPVADGYHVSNSLLSTGTTDREQLLARYEPAHPVPPYRLSVPTRGVYAEAVMGECDSCEDVKENSSQDWSRFGVDEPTAIIPVTTPTPTRTDWKAVWAQFAQPIVQIQTAREAPAPGAGLAGLSEALTESGVFRDVTGLSGNQDNVIRTYLSNQENARAFAEMAKAMASQEHNTSHSRSIMQTLDAARASGAIGDEDHRQLVGDHLSRVVDGGDRQTREVAREVAREPSLERAGIDAVERGREVRARTRAADGTEQDLEVGSALFAQAGGGRPSFDPNDPVYQALAKPALRQQAREWAAERGAESARRRIAIETTLSAEYSAWGDDPADLDGSRIRELEARPGSGHARQQELLNRLETYSRAAQPNQGRVFHANQALDYAHSRSPWSAAFVSAIYTGAGLGLAEGFRVSAGHSQYILEALVNRLNRDYMRPFWLFRHTEVPVAVGDIICKSRAGASLDFDETLLSLSNGQPRIRFRGGEWSWGPGEFTSHADIVHSFEVAPDGSRFVFTVGGNIQHLDNTANTAGKKKYRLAHNGSVEEEVRSALHPDVVAGTAAENSTHPNNSVWAVIKMLDLEDFEEWQRLYSDYLDAVDPKDFWIDTFAEVFGTPNAAGEIELSTATLSFLQQNGRGRAIFPESSAVDFSDVDRTILFKPVPQLLPPNVA